MLALEDVDAFVQTLVRSRSPQELERHLEDVSRALGFHYYALVHHVDLAPFRPDLDHVERRGLIALSNYPPG